MKSTLCTHTSSHLWLILGIGAGTALGVALKNIALGLALGAAFGLVMRAATSKKA